MLLFLWEFIVDIFRFFYGFAHQTDGFWVNLGEIFVFADLAFPFFFLLKFFGNLDFFFKG